MTNFGHRTINRPGHTDTENFRLSFGILLYVFFHFA